MTKHTHYEELLILYVAGRLSTEKGVEIERHLSGCPVCQADLNLWKDVGGEIKEANRQVHVPPALAQRALERVHLRVNYSLSLLRVWQLLRSQALLVQSELWSISAVVLALGVGMALIAGNIRVIYFLAPLVAASSLALLYGPEQDPALELSLATPTSPWKILLARMSIVFTYNLLLTMSASLILVWILPSGILSTILLGWLGPASFLSALALFLSVRIGSNRAIGISYGLWLLHYIPFQSIGLWMQSDVWISILSVYRQFWGRSSLLFPLALLFLGLSLWSANRRAFRWDHTPG